MIPPLLLLATPQTATSLHQTVAGAELAFLAVLGSLEQDSLISCQAPLGSHGNRRPDPESGDVVKAETAPVTPLAQMPLGTTAQSKAPERVCHELPGDEAAETPEPLVLEACAAADNDAAITLTDPEIPHGTGYAVYQTEPAAPGHTSPDVMAAPHLALPTGNAPLDVQPAMSAFVTDDLPTPAFWSHFDATLSERAEQYPAHHSPAPEHAASGATATLADPLDTGLVTAQRSGKPAGREPAPVQHPKGTVPHLLMEHPSTEPSVTLLTGARPHFANGLDTLAGELPARTRLTAPAPATVSGAEAARLRISTVPAEQLPAPEPAPPFKPYFLTKPVSPTVALPTGQAPRTAETLAEAGALTAPSPGHRDVEAGHAPARMHAKLPIRPADVQHPAASETALPLPSDDDMAIAHDSDATELPPASAGLGTERPPPKPPVLLQHAQMSAAPSTQANADAASTAAEQGIELSLAPQELGRVRLTLHSDGDRVHAHIRAEQPETLDLLRRNGEQLLVEFKAAGFRQADMHFGQWAQGGERHEHTPAALAPSDPPDPAVATTSADLSASKPRISDGLDLRL